MAPNRVFFPQRALDQWLADAVIDFAGRELLIKAANRKYIVVEAARILQEVSGSEDMYDLVGRVKSMNYLAELGAELLETSMILGDNAYEIIPGFVGSPAGNQGDLHADGLADPVEPFAMSEEELLIQCLVEDKGRISRG